MKKLTGILLALCLVLALFVPAAAAETAPAVSVQWMGETVAFPDAQPVIRSGRTMVPVRAIAEAAGAAVDFDAGLVTVTAADGTAVRFRPGEETAERVSGGETETVLMDTAPYIEGGRTYVPLRFFSAALDYDVFWDNDARCAVVADRAALTAELDAPFARVNAALAALREKTAALGETKKLSGSAELTLTALDSLNGDQTGSAALRYTVLAGKTAVDARFTLDGASLISLLLPDAELYDDADRAALELIKTELGKTELRVIYDRASGDAYIRVPAFFGTLAEVTLPAETWLKLTAEDLALEDYSGEAALLRADSVGALLYDAAALTGFDAGSVAALRADAAAMAQVLGDAAFAGDTATLGGEQRDALAAALGAETLELSVTAREAGSFAAHFALSTAEAAGGLTLSAAPGRTELNAELHVKNTLRAAFALRGTAQRYSGAVPSAPPADAAVYMLDDLLVLLGSAGDVLTEIPGALMPLTGK